MMYERKEGKGEIVKEVESGFIKWFSELSNKDISIAGGKGASLAEMYNHKFPVPPGFIVSAQAYAHFIEKSGVWFKIKEILDTLNVEDTKELEEDAKDIREMIENAQMPKEVESEILEAYDILDVDKQTLSEASSTALTILKNSHEPPFVAIRSSATTEDLADASFAGQQESFLNVKGHRELIISIKKCFASLFTARAIYYRTKKGFDHEKSKLAIVVQRMIDSEKSGVMFSRNPVSNDDNILIEAVFGLGEGIVSGMIMPDGYIVDRNFDIKDIKISYKKLAIVRNSSGHNEIVKLTGEKGKQRVLSNHEIKRLAQYAVQLEEHYLKPQDIEFALEAGNIYIVQSRPITTKAQEGGKQVSGKILLSGLGASPGIVSGVVRIIHSLDELNKVSKGDILVTQMTNPDMVVSMQKAAGIITDEGGITSHAAIVSREMGIPAVVGTGNATETLKDGQIVTVDGGRGQVIEGQGQTHLAEINKVVPTKIEIKVIVDLPDYAKRAAESGVKAIGLTRIEGIIASSGKHPIAFVKNRDLKGYIQLLYNGLKKISEPFQKVWIRTSDIRSDEFRHLEGAVKEIEGNPMLGDHGIRFGLRHPEILESEFKAVKELADEFPDKEFGVMMPQIISVNELKESKRIANQLGMPENVKIGIMVETPAAVQIINELCEEGISFISFGTNDLTQYVLAIDRNNEDVQYLYDEMNPAVLSAISFVIRRCKKYGVETSICGQAGSNEDMVRFLVKEGINSISANADAAESISKIVAEIEKETGSAGQTIHKHHEKVIERKEKKVEIEDNEKEEESSGKRDRTFDMNAGMISHNEVKDIEAVILEELEKEIPPEGIVAESGEDSGEALEMVNALAKVGVSEDGSERAEAKLKEDIKQMFEGVEGRAKVENEIADEAQDDEDIGNAIGNEYVAAGIGKENDIPLLNDAIPIESRDLEKIEDEDIIELSEMDEFEIKEDKKTDLF